MELELKQSACFWSSLFEKYIIFPAKDLNFIFRSWKYIRCFKAEGWYRMLYLLGRWLLCHWIRIDICILTYCGYWHIVDICWIVFLVGSSWNRSNEKWSLNCKLEVEIRGYYGNIWSLVTDKRVGSWSVNLDVIELGNDKWLCAHSTLFCFAHSTDCNLLYLKLSDTFTSPIGLWTCQGQELSRKHELIQADGKKRNWG